MPPPIPGNESSSDVGDLDNIESIEPVENKGSRSKANGKVTTLPQRGTSRSVDDEEDGDGGEGDGEDGPDVFTVEAIVGHEFRNRVLLYNVKWEGYPTSENTLEPEDNLLPDAIDVLAAYYKSIGGKPQTPRDPSKKKGQARPQKPTGRSVSASDSPPASKRQKTSTSATSTPAAKSKSNTKAKLDTETSWLPKREDWEPDINRVDTIDRDEAGNLMVFLVFKNGKKTKVSMDQVYRHCPRPMLRFYEEHLKFK